MSGSLKFFREVFAWAGGEKVAHEGNRWTPRKEVAIVGKPRLNKTMTVPAGTEKVLWTYEAGNDFAWASFEASGYCELRWKCDKPTSASDKTPLGTFVVWMRKRLSCYGTEVFDTNTAMCADTAADAVATSAGGVTKDEGFIYEFRVYNPGTAAIDIDCLIVE